jgi:hypothetical protein
MKRYLLFAFGIAVITGSTAHAHPGHGTNQGPSTLTHYLAEPVHLATILGAAALLLAFAGMRSAGRRKRHGDAERVIV